MARYDSVDCPICKKPLSNGENIVVCPTCGAPYHRSCFSQEGNCVFTELHLNCEAWQPPKKEEKFGGNAELRCSRCDTVNPQNGLFCQVCGNQLNDKTQDAEQNPQGKTPQLPFGIGGFAPPGMPLNPFTTPFGGVAPDEVIDEIPAKDLAVFVGRNSHYYLPRFKEISNKRSKILNWSAFFFHGGFFIYRKMYGIGIIAFILSTLFAIPNALMMYQTLNATVSLAFDMPMSTEALTQFNLVCSFLRLALRLVCGLYANTFYKAHAFKKIKKEKAKMLPETEYLAILTKKGSVAIKLVSGLLIGYMVLYIISVYLIVLLQI
ncbi:MAG: RING finger protein [Oscillospiraceae bacterium]